MRIGLRTPAILAGLVAAALSATAARAANLVVTNTNDSGGGSLRTAITVANGTLGPDRITFQVGLTGVIAPATELPVISEEITIVGPGPRNLTISGSTARRILNFTAPATISGLRLANAFTDRGGGILFSSTGLLDVSDCHFDQNTVTNEGGAICMLAGSLAVRRTTFTTDQAAGSGGCIWYGQGGGAPTATVTNCTFVNNFASTAGGAIRQFGATNYTSAITNCTFVVNNAGNNGGAIAVAGGSMTLLNSLFAVNNAGGNPGGHVIVTGGSLTSLGHNLFGNLNGSNLVPDPTDKFGVVGNDLNTGVLIAFPFNNGGLTDTTPLLANSIAIDGGTSNGAPLGDQRDFPRVGCAPDVGAFEFQTPADSDGDGVINCLDQCSGTPACASVNEQGCPTDGDADGVFDGCDICPGTFAGEPVGANGCSTADEDGDGVLNDQDRCRGTPACARASIDAANGCPTDVDSDGLFDGCDRCPGSNDLTDSDGDGIPNCLDVCPDAGDGDGDGVQDCRDGCPANAQKRDPGQCGCDAADVDTDGDGALDCNDGCPNDASKRDPGACGCGNSDADANGNGTPDCQDLPPAPSPAPMCGAGMTEAAMAMAAALMFAGRAGRRRSR